MASNANNPQDLERLVHQTLRSLPNRRAPRTLEHRVLAAIAARQALPWYRQSFTHWPLAARAAFLLLSAVLAVLAVRLGTGSLSEASTALSSARSSALDSFAPALSVTRSVSESFSLLFRAIPPLWLYGGIAVVASAYLAFFGLGATAYRTLVAKH